MTPSIQPSEGEDVLTIMAEVMERQARVQRAEVSLNQARRRLGESLDRLSCAKQRGADVPPLGATLLEHRSSMAPVPREELPAREKAPGTLRERTVALLDAAPGETFTVARVALALDHDNRDTIRNTLLVLAATGRVEKIGIGQYRAKKEGGAP